MIKLKSLLIKTLVLGVVAMQFPMSASAMTTTKEVEHSEPMLVETFIEDNDDDRFLAPGVHTQHPNEGGTWQYGFWSLKVRSYYTVNRCHGSTVVFNGKMTRSINTISGKKSIAEKWAVNLPWNDDAYYYRICK